MANPLIYNAFGHVTPNHHSHGYWRHDEGQHQLDFHRLEPWVELARQAERGCFDTVFMADVVGVYGKFRGSIDTSIQTGMQFPSHDPAVLISAMAYATQNIGFVVTSAPMQEHPFTFARKMSTLDHLTSGRIGWNIVTSYLDNAARNFGHSALPEHDSRYAWAEEYLEVTYKLWEESWADDALRLDRDAGIYADPARVRKINHVSPRYQVEGPHLVQPSPQRTPVLFQAGGSEVGRNFAAKHAEATFSAALDVPSTAEDVIDIRRRAVAQGRRASDIKILVTLAPIIGSTEEEARRKQRELRDWFSMDALQAFWSGALGVDLSAIDPTDRIDRLLETNYVRGSVRAFVQSAPDGVVTFGDLLRHTWSGRHPGTPEQIADLIAEYASVGVDGFNIVPVTTLGWWSTFVDEVVPVLRKRGLIRSSYSEGSLREKLFGQKPRLPEYHSARQQRLSALAD